MKRILPALLLACAASIAAAQNLTLGNKLELNTLDPHFFASFAPNSSLQYFFDKLTEYDDKLKVRRRSRHRGS
jgi:peptide/nickel transport system substrate-binding protein